MNEEVQLCTICHQPLAASGRCPHCDVEGHVWTIRDWRPLLALALAIALGFSFTRLVVGGYNQVKEAMALRYSTRGSQALAQHKGMEAVRAYESALVYDHDNVEFRLKLTDALLAAGAANTARSQLRDYRELHPEDALVNLKLARIEARAGRSEDALLYYRDAISGAWPDHEHGDLQKIDTELEVADYLARLGRSDEAEGVLARLSDSLPAGSPEQIKLAGVFLKNGDLEHARQIYQMLMGRDPGDEPAVVGAARVELAEGKYLAARKLVDAIAKPSAEARALQSQLARAEALDPFAKGGNSKIRAARTIAVYQVALRRLAGCGAPFAMQMTGTRGTARDASEWAGFARWAEQLQPVMNERRLRGRDDVIESAMRFAFQAEAAAQKDCAAASLDDEALNLLARQRLGAAQ
ncbi:MAG: hypothetical protein P4M01_06820 [Acidobacteriota bacterium]|nr:hypothetical protein [Acidobacteriota bacterium]